MKKYMYIVTATVLITCMYSCATIFSSSKYPVQFKSTPNKVLVEIIDRDGVMVYQGETPAVVQLKANKGFMKKAIYNIKFSKNGFTSKSYSISATLDQWYWANLVLGGVIGMLIVDPASGAMFQINTPFIDAVLSSESNSNNIEDNTIQVYDINNIPEHWKEHLSKIN